MERVNQFLLSLAIAVLLSISFAGCASTNPPSLMEHLQTQDQIKDLTVPTHLTDLGILLYGENILSAWGLRSRLADRLNYGGELTLAALSTGALAAGTGNPAISHGMTAAFTGLLQALGVVKPAERNAARQEGAGMILDARGNFLEALAAKRVYHISNTRFTPQGALYFKQIGAALKVVDKLLVGLAPRIADLEALRPVPVNQQPDPERDMAITHPTLNANVP